MTVKPLNGNRFPVGLRAGREAAGQIAEHWKVLVLLGHEDKGRRSQGLCLPKPVPSVTFCMN